MNNPNRTRQLISALMALSFGLLLPGADAAERIWTGGGVDNNWGTPENWGGTAPVNGDHLNFSGTTQQNSVNNINNLSVGWLRFTGGGFNLSGNSFTLNPAPAGIITNLAGVNTIANNLTITPAGKYWSIAPGSELRLTGSVTNTSAGGTSVGWLCLTNGGTVRILGNAVSARGMDLWQGAVIVDGGYVDANNDGICFKPPTGSTVAVHLTNNGTIRIGGGGNFRMGNARTGIGAAAGPDSVSEMHMSSGLLELYGPNVTLFVGDNIAGAKGIFNQNGGMVRGSAGAGNTLALGNLAGADGVYNLNGGTLWIAQVRQANAGAANAVFNFNGGTLKPTVNSATFMQGLIAANVLNGGAVIDTTNLNITIAQSLQGAGSGGLTKLGNGTLTLAGGNTYSGATVVSNGTLVTSSSSFFGGGVITIANSANLTVPYIGGSLSASTLTFGSSVTNSITVDFSGSPFPGGAPAISVNTLNASGTALIHIGGAGLTSGSYPLIAFTTASGLGSVKLGTLPSGVSATLVQSGNTLNLNVAMVPKSLAWSGTVSGNWDTSTLNWFDLNNGMVLTNYAQSGGSGDAVTFDDLAVGGITSVNIAGTVTPSQVTVNNNIPYVFSGAGKISGGTSLTKSGTGFASVTLGTANDYTGGTTLSAGSIFVGHNQALGSGPVTLNFGTLASDSTAARVLPNPVLYNANTGILLGDTVNNGTLTLAGAVDLGGAGRTLQLISDIIITGPVTNGGVTTKLGPGRLTLKGESALNVLSTQQQGDVVVDGVTVTNADGWRLQGMMAGETVRLVVTNGGMMHIAAGNNTGNLRVGLTGGEGSVTHVVDVSGTLSLAPVSAAVTVNNAVGLGQSGASAVLNLRAGGLLITRALFGDPPAVSEAHFSGGTIRAISNESGFMLNLTAAYMEAGGLTVDTTNFSVTISQSLLAAGGGGLAKNGAGTLTLTGTNTYSGATVVNAGKLVIAPAHAATGGVTVHTDATLALLSSAPGAQAQVTGVSAQNGSRIEAQFSGLAGNPTTPAGHLGNLVLNGTVGVNLAASGVTVGQFPLFAYSSISGSGSLVIGQLPQGMVATLLTNTGAQTIDLLVSSLSPIVWTGADSGVWDLAALNWTLNGNSTAFQQNDSVVLNDTAVTAAVTVSQALTPSGVLVSNSVLNYSITGGGSLGGGMNLVKRGSASLILGTGNSFSGAVTVQDGTLIIESATALGSTAGATTVQSGGALDVNGRNLGLEPVVVGGAGVAGNGALINSGATQNDALRNVTVTSDVVIRANDTLGIRTSAETDPGFIGNGYKVTKVGPGQLNLNGGLANPGATIWESDIGDVDVLEGVISFQRRMTMGRQDRTITVHPGAGLLLFALNPAMAIQTKPVVLNGGSLHNNGNNAAEGSTFGGPVTLLGGSNSFAGLTGTTLRLTGPVSGAGSLYFNNASAGTVALEGNVSHTGLTVIDAGTVRLESTASMAATPSIRIVVGATLDVTSLPQWTLGVHQELSGAGVINGNVLANGTIAPGSNSLRTLTFNGDVVMAGTNVMEVSKEGGLTNDTISVNGTLTYGGRLAVVLAGATPLAVNDTFKLYSFVNPPSGSFTISLPSGYTWDTTQLPVDGTIRVTGVVSSPVFGNLTLSGGILTLTGSGGASGAEYRVVSATNLASPVLNWSPVLTNTFAPDGKFTNAFPVTSGEPQRFFRLWVP